MIVHSVDGNFAIRDGRWKYVEGKASPTVRRVSRRAELGPQLYDLVADPEEQDNRIATSPEIADRLATILETHRRRGHTR